jgi:hypothetical protein
MPSRPSRRNPVRTARKEPRSCAALSIQGSDRLVGRPIAGGGDSDRREGRQEMLLGAGRPGGSEATRRYDHLPEWSPHRRCQRTQSNHHAGPRSGHRQTDVFPLDASGLPELMLGEQLIVVSDDVASTHAKTRMSQMWANPVGDRSGGPTVCRRTALPQVWRVTGGRSPAGRSAHVRATSGQGRSCAQER